MSLLLGIDLGSSSVKVALVDSADGRCLSTASYPDSEAPIKALQPGWAEQRPTDWWDYLTHALKALKNSRALMEVEAIGISYQMHGLVCIDKELQPLRDAIIWCDSRAVPYGQQAFDVLGHEYCLSLLLNSPGNFTTAKLAWVKANQPGLFEKIKYVMLPGDYLALRLTGMPATTAPGLSEMILWDYSTNTLSSAVMEFFGFPAEIIPPIVPTFGPQAAVSASAASELGLRAGTPVTYRAGDQPNNALSLQVLKPGEIAATAGTSGVVYGITDKVNYDPLSRVNTFLHVNHTPDNPRLGVMHCVNGCGILNAWIKRTFGDIPYDEMNRLAASVPVGSEGLSIIPFGNGAERVLQNKDTGCSIQGINFNRHSRAHLLRAAQEGIVFSLYYGMEVMQSLSMKIEKIHAGKANMFLSPLFRETLATVSGATIELYDTDGAIGAARGAGLGAGIYSSADEAFVSLQQLLTLEPAEPSACREAYIRWKALLEKQ